ncbi:MAG: hypothetical protein C5B59_19075 [Bacteroidetes bacterium]|nr:MAG: hypothetical protein C5B59_19075 [Bacteroidota bacterium]
MPEVPIYPELFSALLLAIQNRLKNILIKSGKNDISPECLNSGSFNTSTTTTLLGSRYLPFVDKNLPSVGICARG